MRPAVSVYNREQIVEIVAEHDCVAILADSRKFKSHEWESNPLISKADNKGPIATVKN